MAATDAESENAGESGYVPADMAATDAESENAGESEPGSECLIKPSITMSLFCASEPNTSAG